MAQFTDPGPERPKLLISDTSALWTQCRASLALLLCLQKQQPCFILVQVVAEPGAPAPKTPAGNAAPTHGRRRLALPFVQIRAALSAGMELCWISSSVFLRAAPGLVFAGGFDRAKCCTAAPAAVFSSGTARKNISVSVLSPERYQEALDPLEGRLLSQELQPSSGCKVV